MPSQSSGGVCSHCRRSLVPIRPPACASCGIELVSERGICTRCREAEFPFERNVAVYPYLGAVRELVHLYKITGRRVLSELFAEVLADVWRREYPGLPIVPVPGRASVYRKRGWEHVDLIAGTLARRHGVTVLRALSRKRGRAQKALDQTGRLTNIRGAFVARRRSPIPPAVVLLDDIFTTGTTLAACAAALLALGCRQVYGLTLGIDE